MRRVYHRQFDVGCGPCRFTADELLTIAPKVPRDPFEAFLSDYQDFRDRSTAMNGLVASALFPIRFQCVANALLRRSFRA